ncbi:hypothetical protein EOPP23_12295 [Endozoicomonas sp. OPT23]|uniref:nucleoside-specific channel-forming Tsx family protein n=1 Tax=Endozoicomonas sp. OPT23 TaxID=2072845 RepID=UPI00129A7BE7|nr:outer membrane protein OmpK [Endozoicomonas sp. OPT23]MRI33765.1 hypothetical protein [Endozoicomonas sp. OPT23]
MKCLKPAVFSSSLALLAMSVNAADYSDDIHKNDYKWMQFNLMYALKELPRPEHAKHDGHDYLEMEFGGRSGALSLYGYVDVFNLTNSSDSDKKGQSKMFMKLAPRFSIDALTGRDLSFGPVKEIYFSTLFNIGGGGKTLFDKSGKPITDSDTNESNWGVGIDLEVPWLGTTGLNLMGVYDLNNKKWDGFQLTGNWFKPFYFFENKTFISYQGYFDFRFGADKDYDKKIQTHTETGFDWFNGIYWHSDRFAAGYGLKYFHDVYTVKDSQPIGGGADKLKTTGFAHYFSVTYKI